MKGKLWLTVFNKAEYGKCHWCKKPLLFDEATVDHLIPFKEWKKLTNPQTRITLVVISCYDCNNERASILTALRNANQMAARLLRMANGQIKTSRRYEALVNDLKEKTIANCKQAYLEMKLKKYEKSRGRESTF